MSFSMMVACTTDGGVGFRNSIPWYNPADMKHFQRVTTRTKDPEKQNAIIMGRKTWESLPRKPLQNRRNVILSRSSLDIRGCEVYGSLDTALSVLLHESNVESIFVIGGGEVYREAILHPQCRRVFVTLMDAPIPCDTHFPVETLHSHYTLDTTSELMEHDGLEFVFQEYTRKGGQSHVTPMFVSML